MIWPLGQPSAPLICWFGQRNARLCGQDQSSGMVTGLWRRWMGCYSRIRHFQGMESILGCHHPHPRPHNERISTCQGAKITTQAWKQSRGFSVQQITLTLNLLTPDARGKWEVWSAFLISMRQEEHWDEALASGEDLIEFSVVLALKTGEGSNPQGDVPWR